MQVQTKFSYSAPIISNKELAPPTNEKIKVAFTLDRGAQVIDFVGPWEVFQDVIVKNDGTAMEPGPAFELFTVAETSDAITVSGGMTVVPNFTVDNAPKPHLIVIPHFQNDNFSAIHEWIKAAASTADLTLSVCTGAFELAKTGLLDGKKATTFHYAFDRFEKTFPNVQLLRGPRFVENDDTATAGGLTSGIDLALRTVERYFDRSIAQHTADVLEYTSEGWKV